MAAEVKGFDTQLARLKALDASAVTAKAVRAEDIDSGSRSRGSVPAEPKAAEEKGLGVHLFPPAVDLRYGYPLALSRVLLNLTTNGLKFTDTGFVEIAVRGTGPIRLEFSVRDTGKGYTPEALDTLYEPFRRTRGGRDRWGFSGTGLGLAISRKLVGALGSSLQVETRPKWGTRFFFELELPPGPESGQDHVG